MLCVYLVLVVEMTHPCQKTPGEPHTCVALPRQNARQTGLVVLVEHSTVKKDIGLTMSPPSPNALQNVCLFVV